MLNKFFEIIRVINLSARTDRWTHCIEEMNKVGFTAERFSAFTGDNRHRAFNKSQHTVLSESLEYESILILEDDVLFQEWHHLSEAMQELPEDWDLIYLGANLIGMDSTQWKMPERYSDHLFKVFNCWQTHAVGYSNKMAKWIVENFPYHRDEYEREGLIIYDEWLRVNVLPNYNCYVVAPQIALQRPSYSDIWNNEGNYTSLFKRGNDLLR